MEERTVIQQAPKTKTPDQNYGLVLGGGGSKGCYHVGVWQAMNEEGIHFDAISGTSIGALVGIFYTTDALDLITDFVFSMQPGNIASDLPILPMTLKEKVKGTKTILNFIIRYFDSKMDITPLRTHFRMMFDYEAFKNSPIRYACMSYNDTKKEPHPFFKGEITAENAEDIVMASAACYPAFPKVVIEGEEYVDGMYADNVPIELLKTILPNADWTVVVDLHDPGEVAPPALTPDMFYIQPLLQPGNPLDFSTEHAEALYSQGYLETKKYLGKYAGYLYTFPGEDQPLMDVVEDYIGRQITQMKVVLPKIDNLPGHLFRQALGYIPPALPNGRQDHYYFGQMIEALALLVKINPIALRDYRQFLEELKEKLDHLTILKRNPEEFLLVNLFSNAKREEIPLQMYRLLKNNNGRLPEKFESFKDRFPASYTLAVIRYCLDLLMEALNPSQPDHQADEAKNLDLAGQAEEETKANSALAKDEAVQSESKGSITAQSAAQDFEKAEDEQQAEQAAGIQKPSKGPYETAPSWPALKLSKPSTPPSRLLNDNAAKAKLPFHDNLPPIPSASFQEMPIGAVCIIEEARSSSEEALLNEQPEKKGV